MTVATTTSRVSYAGNGSTTTFAVNFYFLAASDLVLIKVDPLGMQTTLVLGTDYTVTGAGVSSGGSVTLTTAPAVNYTLVIYRDPALTQVVDYQPNDPFPAETHERALDKLTMITQRLRDLVSRSLRLSDGDTSTASTLLPTPAANQLIGWNNTGTGLQNVDQLALSNIVAFGTGVANLFSGTGAQTVFVLSANPGNQANLDVSISGVTQVPGIDYIWSNGTTLTFTSAPAAGTDNILVRFVQALPQTYSALTHCDTFTQSGATVNFTLSAVPQDENATQVYVNGVYQMKSSFSLTGSTLTFSEAPPKTSKIEVVYL